MRASEAVLTDSGVYTEEAVKTVEPVFGIIKSVMGLRRFLLRGVEKVSTEWTWVSLAYNLKRMQRMQQAGLRQCQPLQNTPRH